MKARLRWALALSLALGLSRTTLASSGQGLHYVRPDAVERGVLIEGYAERAGSITLLQNVGRDKLQQIENTVKATATSELFQSFGLTAGAISQMRSLVANVIPDGRLYSEGFADAFAAVREVAQRASGGRESSGNNDVMAEFLTEAVKKAISQGDTSYFTEESGRREFWESVGLYEKYSDAQIAYINKVVMPSLAAGLVQQDWNSLFYLWQSLNGVGADVSLLHGENAGVMNQLTGSVMFGGNEFAVTSEVLEAFNGSTGALGLLYHAAGQYGSGTGSYASTNEALATFGMVWNIPEPEHEPIGGYSEWSQGRKEGPTVNYTLKIRITK